MKFHRLDTPFEDELELEMALWLANAKPDDPYVLKVLTEHYAGDLLRFFLALLDEGKKQTDTDNFAAALAQRVLYKAIEVPQNFQGQESVRNWLFQLAIEEFKSLPNNRGHSNVNAILNTGNNKFIPYADEKFSLTEEDVKVLTALQGLSQEERIPIILHYMFQTSTAKISRFLTVRIPTVHKKIRDFRMVVNQNLEENDHQYPTALIKHQKFETWIQLSVDGILEYDPISGAKLNQHLDKCPVCRAFRDHLIKIEVQIASAFLKRWPELKFSEIEVVQIVESYQAPPKKSFPLFPKIGLNQESILLGVLLIAVIITGYFITRRETHYANPMVYPTLTLKPSVKDSNTSSGFVNEVSLEVLDATPTTTTGSGITAVQLSEYGTNGTNERRYNYYREPTITASKRFVIFSTSFTTITNQGPEFKNILYLFDQQTGKIVVLNNEGVEYQSDIWDFVPNVSDDGSSIVFQDVIDKASSDDPTFCNRQTDSISCTGVYLYDQRKNSTEIVSPMLDENVLNGPNILPTISADGRWIAFWSADTDLLQAGGNTCGVGDTSNHCWNIVILDRETAEVSTLPVGRVNSNYTAWDFEPLSLSGNGEMIAFTIHRNDSLAAELKIENQTETILYDQIKSEYQFLNTSNNGKAGNGPSTHAVLSADGRFAVFASSAEDLISNDTNEAMDVFVRDMTSHQITRVSVSSEGNQGNDASGVYFFSKETWKESLGISNDGRYVTFMSSSDNLVFDPPTDCPSNSWFPCTNVYIHDMETSRTELISAGSHRRDSVYNHISIAPSGRFIAYAKSDVDCFQAPVCSRIFLHDQDTSGTIPILDDIFINFGLTQSKAPLTRLVDESMRGVSSLAFSPKGDLLASGSNDRSVRLWDLSNGELQTTLDGHKQLVSEIDFSHDGNYLASASHDGTVNIWDIETGEMESFSGPSGSILSLDYSPDGGYLAVGASNAAWLWDLTQQPHRINHSQQYPGAQINSVDFSPAGDMIAHGSSDNSVWIIKRKDGVVIARLGNHDGDILTTAFSQDGNYLASGSADAVVNVWKITQLDEDEIEFDNILSIQNADWINDLTFSPDSKLLAVASFGSEVQVWEIPSGIKSEIEPGSRWDQALSVAFSPNGDLIAVGSSWGGIQLWNNPAP